jgi:hypothetical protein
MNYGDIYCDILLEVSSRHLLNIFLLSKKMDSIIHNCLAQILLDLICIYTF